MVSVETWVRSDSRMGGLQAMRSSKGEGDVLVGTGTETDAGTGVAVIMSNGAGGRLGASTHISVSRNCE